MKTKLILFVLSLMSVLSLSAKNPDAALPEVSSSQEATVNVRGGDVFITGYGLPAFFTVDVYISDLNNKIYYMGTHKVSDRGTIDFNAFLYPGVYAIRAVTPGGTSYVSLLNLSSSGGHMHVIFK